MIGGDLVRVRLDGDEAAVAVLSGRLQRLLAVQGRPSVPYPNRRTGGVRVYLTADASIEPSIARHQGQQQGPDDAEDQEGGAGR